MKSDAYTYSGVPVIRGTNLTGGKVFSGEWVYVSEKTADDLSNCCVYPGDLVFPHRGAIGEVGIVPDQFPRYVMSSSLMTLSCDRSKAEPDYIYYFFKSAAGRHELLKNASQVGTPGIGQPLSTLRSIEVPLPPPSSQRVIAKILGDLDSKIDLNRRINQTLEAMAQALFKSWFVDFDPVKVKIAAKAEGRDPLRAAMSIISGKAEVELDTLPPEQYQQLAATAALFPDAMEESELGEIPKGWAFKSVADIAEFTTGKVEVSSLTQDLYISTENMLENRAGITRATSLPSVATVPNFKVGHVLISNIRPYFKKIWMARFDGGRSADVLAFKPADFQWTEFVYNLMYQDAFFEFMTRTAKGAKMPRGDKNAIMGWRFPCPDEPLMVAFSAKLRPHYAYIDSLRSQNKSLSELRDTLLPKLLSGELSVKTLAESTGAA
ncbi:type I restriction endonuclease [Aeromonas cavernicola]|uniref:Type I restriction endonuclease n=2 Tax=Aeromonas cavernicola TaxID=1006623 RepID=A0A2H9U6U9_9GAMM|nr:type I restriction endonuclease [Aeromonas cavernicola]